MPFLDDLRRFGPDASEQVALEDARAYCARLTTEHYENFSVVTWLTPRGLRPALQSIYAFCRWSDDLGDEVGDRDRARSLLSWWRGELRGLYQGHARHPVMVALRETIREFAIPIEPFEALISAFEQDQDVTDYATYAQLLDYCTRSANPVGHLVLYLARSYNEENARLSDLTCTGLQLANFWQDVARDHAIGRIYLPREDRERFGVTEDDIAARRFTAGFAALLSFEVDRARDLLRRGQTLVPRMPRALAVDVDLFSRGGLAILERIAAQGFDVLSARPSLSKQTKAALLGRAPREVGIHRQEGREWRMADGGFEIRDLKSAIFVLAVQLDDEGKTVDEALRASYRFCGALSRREARNFYYSFLLLPADRRRSMCALYAFLRHTDDLADEPGTVALKQEALEDWRRALGRALDGRPDAWPGLPALADAVQRHAIPARHLHEVIDGVMLDLHPRHYATFEDLYGYCYLVASAVGLSCLHIWGYDSQGGRAETLAESCGIALQLTNILRDVREDAQNGRIYLPRDDMDRFGVTPEALSNPVTGAELRALLEFEGRRAEGYYAQAEALVGLVAPVGRPVLRAIVGIYRALLDEIAARGYDVLPRRVALPPWRKAAIAWRSLAFRCLCVDSTALEGPRC